VYDHRLELSCDRYLPVDATQIPTGQLAPVEGTPYDLRAHPDHRHGRRLGDVIPLIDGGGRPGVDHCFVVNGAVEDAAGAGDEPVLRLVALLTDDASGRQLVCEASQPGVQVYTANWLAEPSSVAADGGLHPSSVGEPDHPHTQHNGVCLETQHFPDAVNQPQFPSAILRPGEVYRHVAVFTFGTV
jgi:aldose 1-epimerase